MANQQGEAGSKTPSKRQLGEVILKAWTDPAFKQRLESDPKAALEEAGVAVPEGVDVKVVEESKHVAYLVIPKKPGDLKVADFRSAEFSCWNSFVSF